MIRHADWLVDVGPGAGGHGGRVIYNGPIEGLANIEASVTRRYLFDAHAANLRARRKPESWLRLDGISRNNLRDLDVAFPVGCFTAVTGVSGSGKSSLVGPALPDLVIAHLGRPLEVPETDETDLLLEERSADTVGRIAGGMRPVRAAMAAAIIRRRSKLSGMGAILRRCWS